MTSAIQHTVLFELPSITPEVEAALQGVVVRFSTTLPGIRASFRAAGAPGADGTALSLAETCEALAWPDKTQGWTHCLLVIADDVPSLKAYLHSELHTSEWVGLVKPVAAGPPLVFDSPLALSVATPTRKVQHTVLFQLPALPAEHEPAMQATVAKFNALGGIAASFRAAGAPGLSLAETCEALAWPDKTQGWTHCLLVIADDVASLKAYLHSELHTKEWVGHMKPAGATGPPIVFDSPLALAL